MERDAGIEKWKEMEVERDVGIVKEGETGSRGHRTPLPLLDWSRGRSRGGE